MVKRIAPMRVISFLLLVAGGALCQSEHPSADLLQQDGSNAPETRHQEMRTWSSLPDSPSAVRPAKPAEKFQSFIGEARSPLTMDAVVINSRVRRGTELSDITLGLRPSFAIPYKAVFTQETSTNNLYPSSGKHNLLYHPSTSSSFMGRATYAASRIFVTRDDFGKKRLNTSYFLAVLCSIANHSASRPYWARSSSAPFNDFGSTIGNDAGINLFHEFGPGIRQMVKGHAPKLVLRIEERITRDQNLRQVVSSSAR
jgi:hypothetical protein